MRGGSVTELRYRRVLLIELEYPTSVYEEQRQLDAGLGYVSEALSLHGITNQVISVGSYGDEKALYASVREFSPDLIGFTMRSLNFRHNYGVIARIEEAFPSVATLVGGPHMSTFKEKALADCPAIDFGVVLEGEETIVELCRRERPFEDILGLLYRTPEGEIHYAGPRPFIQDLDAVAFPTYSTFMAHHNKVVPIVSSRGCPYSCIFCPVGVTIGRKWRARSAANVAEEIEWWYRKGYRQFDFTDDNFTLQKKRVYEFCEEVERRGLKGTLFSCGNGIRADGVDRALLARMKEVGFYQVSFGVEAGNDRILKNIKKGETIDQIRSAIAYACELDYQVKLTFLIGSPGETWADIEDSLRLAKEFPVWKVNFFNLIPFPGAELYDWISERGYWLVDPDECLNEVNHWSYDKPAFETPELSAAERIRAADYANSSLARDGRMEKAAQKFERLKVQKVLEARGVSGKIARLAASLYLSDRLQGFLERHQRLADLVYRARLRLLP